MIKLLYTKGEKAGQEYYSWLNIQQFCQETIQQVAMVAYENKLDQKSVFTHYGFEVVTTATGANGFKNGVLASMNFWLDSVPDVIFEYDSGDAEGDARQIAFYELMHKIGEIPGMQLFRTSSRLWNLYNELDNGMAKEPIKIWEPTVDHPQELLIDYPRVGAMLEAAGLLGSEKEREVKVGEWAFMEMLNGADPEKTMRIVKDVKHYENAKLPVNKYEIPEDLFAVIYAFLEGKFYEELNLNSEE